MEYEQTPNLFELSYIEKLLEWNLETASAFQPEKPDSHAIQDSHLDDQFMERLLQMEADFSTEAGLDDNNDNNLSVHVSQEVEDNTFLRTEDSYHSDKFKVLSEGSLIDLLLTGAKAVEDSNWPLTSDVITRLNDTISHPGIRENTFNNMVFYFTRGLHYKSRNAPEVLVHGLLPTETETMSIYKMLQEQSPYVKFAQFTANQAILEASEEECEVHVIDLDIMEGIQWPSLMVDLTKRNCVSLKITAIPGDSQNAAMIQQTGRRLTGFANSIGLPFSFNQMVIEKEEDFDRIEVGHVLIANCMVQQLHLPSRNFSLVKTFLNGVSRLSVNMIVLVEEDMFNFAKVPYLSFVEFFGEAIQHYSALFDSLAHSFSSVAFRLVEKEIMGLRIVDCVRIFPSERAEKMLWEDCFSSLMGYKPLSMSASNVYQAKLLVGLFGRGYWVQHENCRLSLCWKSRSLTTVSIWVPTNIWAAMK